MHPETEEANIHMVNPKAALAASILLRDRIADLPGHETTSLRVELAPALVGASCNPTKPDKP